VPHVEQELLTFPEHLSSPPVVSGVCVARSLVAYVMFYRALLFCPFSLGHDLRCMSFELRRLITTSLVSSILMTYYYSNNVFSHCYVGVLSVTITANVVSSIPAQARCTQCNIMW